jgi:phosphatidylglycerophosphate synthase
MGVLSAFLFFPLGSVILAGIIVQLSSVLDGVDGDLAKLSNKVTATGGFLDSVLDRYADIAILVGIGGYCHFLEGNEYAIVCVFAAIIGSLMVSYTRAASEKIQGFSFRSPISNYLSNRDVRLFAVFVGSLLAFVFKATGYPIITFILVFIAVITNATVMRRIIEIGRHKVHVGDSGSNASLEYHATAD